MQFNYVGKNLLVVTTDVRIEKRVWKEKPDLTHFTYLSDEDRAEYISTRTSITHTSPLTVRADITLAKWSKYTGGDV